MSVVQYEKPPTFDVKIIAGKKVVIWNTEKGILTFLSIEYNVLIKIFPGKGNKTKPQTADSSKLEENDGDKNTKDKNGNSKNALDENKNANEQKVKKDIKPKEKEKELTIKKVDKKDNKDNRQSAQDNPKEDPNIAVENVTPSHADGNIAKKEKQKVKKVEKDFEDPEMKRRSTSPPSLSSSYRLLPPIKKENEVFRQKKSNFT